MEMQGEPIRGGQLCRFVKLNGLSLRMKPLVSQEDPERMIAKHVPYIIQVKPVREKHKYRASDITAMGEIPVWCRMITETNIDTTRKKYITLKTTSQEKARVPVCLAAKADEIKIKPT